MGEIVMHSQQSTKDDGTLVVAEERAEYLIKNGYPVPTENVEELTVLIAEQMKKVQEEQEKKPDEYPSLSRQT